MADCKYVRTGLYAMQTVQHCSSFADGDCSCFQSVTRCRCLPKFCLCAWCGFCSQANASLLRCIVQSVACLQVADALRAFDAQLARTFASLAWQDGPAQWQSILMTSYFPTAHQAQGSQQASGASHDMGITLGPAMHAAVAMHGLPATDQPASASVLSCVRCLAGVIDLLSCLAGLPGFSDHVAQGDLKTVVTAVARLTPATHGYVAKQGKLLMGLIKDQSVSLVQRVEEQEQQKQQAVILGLLTAWKVHC